MSINTDGMALVHVNLMARKAFIQHLFETSSYIGTRESTTRFYDVVKYWMLTSYCYNTSNLS